MSEDTSTICKVCSGLCDKIGDKNNIGFTKQYCCLCFWKEFTPDIAIRICHTCAQILLGEKEYVVASIADILGVKLN